MRDITSPNDCIGTQCDASRSHQSGGLVARRRALDLVESRGEAVVRVSVKRAPRCGPGPGVGLFFVVQHLFVRVIPKEKLCKSLR